MCAIIGALLQNVTTGEDLRLVNVILNTVVTRSKERGRDGYGYSMHFDEAILNYATVDQNDIEKATVFPFPFKSGRFIANRRAEPTTEYVKEKSLDDQQPYSTKYWSIVHNGTIANDVELRTNEVPTRIDSAAIVEALTPPYALRSNRLDQFREMAQKLVGSYAIIGENRDYHELLLAANYRPIWYIKTQWGFFFASSRDYFPSEYAPQMLDPYSVAVAFFAHNGEPTMQKRSLRLASTDQKKRALVVCSGGLDSVVAATQAFTDGYEIELIHFQYGSRAEGQEVVAVRDVATYFACKLTLFPLPVYKPGDSPLLRADSTIAGGEAGAEFAHEWVPARNLLLLSVATAYAEANGFDTLVLGNNLEEAGAYPDNEPEFIAKFNDLLPFAVGDGKRMKVIMPVGNMMKHEIVKLGHDLGAPMHLTWSCYRADSRHCGTCGPCFMRRTAFRINNLPEVIEYKEIP